MDWTLKVLDDNWRVFKLKRHHKHLSQMGHQWKRVAGSVGGVWYRNYICMHCGVAMRISNVSLRIRCGVYYNGEHTTNSCKELRMDRALE